ncbi:MAG: hypothetical protein ACREU6_16130, partial [Steroidobacteraceae bacterium]
ILGIALACGLILMPLLIWLIGNRVLGPYTHGTEPAGGPVELLADYFVGLAQGSVIFWCVALGPYALLWFVRAVYALLRSAPATSTSRSPDLGRGRSR